MNMEKNSFIQLAFAIVLTLSTITTTRAFKQSYLSLQPYHETIDYDYAPRKETVLEKCYHGLVRENETLVEITPILKVDEEKICGFTILKKQFHETPFKIYLSNNLGVLRATKPLNCEKRKSYHFEIVAIYCDGTHSAPASIHVTIVDVNEYAPVFSQQSYIVEVDEGRLYKEIIRVEAIDKDCTPLFGDVCRYSILNSDQPFVIDNDGFIKNTEPLSHKISQNHILSVVAFDCAMKESAPVMVNIKVRRVCETKFLGIPERIDSNSVNEGIFLFPKLNLELCDMQCPDGNNMNLSVTIILKTNHISFGCDRDKSKCSFNKDTTDLLPSDVEWTKTIKRDEGLDPIYHFDGESGVLIPENIVSNHDFSKKTFSIVTVFRHSELTENNKHLKEHIICTADDHKMNRHHMALFIRNCRLILLLRKNFKEGDLNIFSPAEWRWKIPHVCDNDWHHYVLNVDLAGKIELFIDGILFVNAFEDKHSNPEVIDDWPLHAAHGVNTTLSVGACFQSSENRLKHGFNGDISEVKIIVGHVLTKDNIKCITNCAEHLELTLPKKKEFSFQVQANDQLNEIFIECNTKSAIEKLLQNIQYKNSKPNPTVGRRNVEIIPEVACREHTLLKIPRVETYIMVNEQNQPYYIEENNHLENDIKNSLKKPGTEMIYSKTLKNEDPKQIDKIIEDSNSTETSTFSIFGNSNKLVSYGEIKAGVQIFKDINLTISSGAEIIIHKYQYVDSCNVLIFPSLNPDHEEISIDENVSFSSSLDIKTTIDKDGCEMVGKDTTKNYLNILRAIIYSNKKPAYYLNRVFKVSCSQFNTRSITGEFTLTLTVLHPKQSSTYSTLQSEEARQKFFLNNTIRSNSSDQYENKLYAHSLLNRNEVLESKPIIRSALKGSNSPTLAIVCGCVFLIIALVVTAIVKMKNSVTYCESQQNGHKTNDEGLLWDDTALTITINPMQMESISDESSDSESESDEDDCIKGKYSNTNQLEWDNSNIFAACNT